MRPQPCFSILTGRFQSFLHLCAFWLVATTATAAQPNIVFILVDDLGKHDLSCEGSTFYETPNIDRIASQAMRFTNGYSACQVCSPSRASIQTGKVPPRVRITDYIAPNGNTQPDKWNRNTRLLPAAYDLQLALEETTLAEALQQLGYSTFFAGKWHLGGEGFSPSEQGYEVNQGGYEYGTPPGGFFSPYRNPKLTDGPPGEQLPLRLGRETAKYIAAQKDSDQPFFAMLSFYSVHAPIQTTQELWHKYRNKAQSMGLIVDRPRFVFDRTQEVRQVQDNPLYAGMMESLDTAVGYVLESLAETKQADNTIVIFTSDNGGVSSGDGYATSCLPMRGGKGRQWEGGIRQPYYIHWPGVTTGSDNDALASGIDFFPTLVEIAGGTTTDSQVDGISLVPALRGTEMSSRPLYWHYPHYGNQGGEPSSIVRDGNWKLIHYYEDGRDELYDLSVDIGEQHDLAAQQPEQVARLKQQLNQWLRDVEARFPTENPQFNTEKNAAALQQAESRTQNRSREHASFLQPDFTPRGGWWQDKHK
ncbi:MAG: sulfatase [Pirellulaceae bacterium]